MHLARVFNISERSKRAIAFTMFFTIVLVGTIKLNIKFSEDISKMGRPLINTSESLLEEAEVLNTDNLIKDRSPIKIYYSTAEGISIRLENRDMHIVINREAVNELKSNVHKGLNTANQNLKETIKEALRSLSAFNQ